MLQICLQKNLIYLKIYFKKSFSVNHDSVHFYLETYISHKKNQNWYFYHDSQNSLYKLKIVVKKIKNLFYS